MLRCTGLADKSPGQLARRQRSFWLGTPTALANMPSGSGTVRSILTEPPPSDSGL
jgi:hypothetical protein